VGQIPDLNFWFRAISGAVDNGELRATVVVIPIAFVDDRTAFLRYRKYIISRSFGGTLIPGELHFHTFSGAALKEREVADLNASKSGICALGIMTWDDGTGSYETEAAQCYVLQRDGKWQWNDLPENNREKAITQRNPQSAR